MKKFVEVKFWGGLSIRVVDALLSILVIYALSTLVQTEDGELTNLRYYLFLGLSIGFLIAYFFITPYFLDMRTISMIIFNFVYLDNNFKTLKYRVLLRRHAIISGFFTFVLILLIAFVNPTIINDLANGNTQTGFSVVAYTVPSLAMTLFVVVSVVNLVVNLFSATGESLQDRLFECRFYRLKKIDVKDVDKLITLKVKHNPIIWKDQVYE